MECIIVNLQKQKCHTKAKIIAKLLNLALIPIKHL